MAQNDTPKKAVWKPLFLEGLAEHGNVSRAAKDARVRRREAYRERSRSDAFREAWDEALEEGIDALEEEARRRAFEGTVKPVVSAGKHVTDVREYSDTLMIFLLKGRRPDVYKDRGAYEMSGPGGGPIATKDVSASRTARDIREIDEHIDELDAEIAALEAQEGGSQEGSG